MPRYIVKLAEDEYMEWSTVVDAPVTYICTRKEFEDFYRKEYGEDGMRTLPERMERVEQKGTSCLLDDSAEQTVKFNRAGPNESTLTFDEIRQRYKDAASYEAFKFAEGRTCDLDYELPEGLCTFPAGHEGPHSFDARVTG